MATPMEITSPPPPSPAGDPDVKRLWSTVEELILAHAVKKIGDNAWVPVSRAIRSRIGNPIREPQYFTAQMCAQKWEKLVEEAQSTRSTGRGAEAPTDAIIERLVQLRLKELKWSIKEHENIIRKVRGDLARIESGKAENDLEVLLTDPLTDVQSMALSEIVARAPTYNKNLKKTPVPALKRKGYPPSPTITTVTTTPQGTAVSLSADLDAAGELVSPVSPTRNTGGLGIAMTPGAPAATTTASAFPGLDPGVAAANRVVPPLSALQAATPRFPVAPTPAPSPAVGAMPLPPSLKVESGASLPVDSALRRAVANTLAKKERPTVDVTVPTTSSTADADADAEPATADGSEQAPESPTAGRRGGRRESELVSPTPSGGVKTGRRGRPPNPKQEQDTTPKTQASATAGSSTVGRQKRKHSEVEAEDEEPADTRSETSSVRGGRRKVDPATPTAPSSPPAEDRRRSTRGQPEATPPVTPRASGRPSKIEPKKANKNTLRGLIKTLISAPMSDVFRRPVTTDEAEDYDEVIKHRMDLSTMSRMVNDGSIATAVDFFNNFYRIIKNAKTYNPKSTEVYGIAIEFCDFGRHEIEPYLVGDDTTWDAAVAEFEAAEEPVPEETDRRGRGRGRRPADKQEVSVDVEGSEEEGPPRKRARTGEATPKTTPRGSARLR